MAAIQDSRGTLLIVDDEEGPRQSLRVVFKEDYNLLLASDGTGAIELARQNKISAAVIDIRMNGMSGIEVLGHLKKLQPSVEIIMLTAYETIDTVRQALRFGAFDYLNKPFDIATIRKAVSSAMERHALAEKIQANNRTLTALQSELTNQKLQEEVVRCRGEIYASIIHDINGPLTVISGLIALINDQIGESERLEGRSLQSIREHLESIFQQVNCCVDISRRYLGFMRQRSNVSMKVSVSQILEDLRQLLRRHPSMGEHLLNIKPLEDDVFTTVNGTDLIQILLNLCINALQSSTQPLEVTVSGRVHYSTPDLSAISDGPTDRLLNPENLANPGPMLQLTVRDTGPGIAPDAMRKIFQPFFTTKPEGQGTGLGLTIVQRLVNESKATLHLHSSPGQGACFSIYFPITVI